MVTNPFSDNFAYSYAQIMRAATKSDWTVTMYNTMRGFNP